MIKNDIRLTIQDAKLEMSRRHLSWFSRQVYPDNVITPFHDTYYSILTLFAKQKIRNLIITVPPQHGKSEGSTRLLPAYIHGIRPNTRICVASYSSPFAMKFNRSVQRIISGPFYNHVFPETYLNGANIVTRSGHDNWLRNATEYEVVNHKGSLLATGRGGAITGNPVDVMIMDDLYKDKAEGNSPIVRDAVEDFYEGTVVKRLNNESQQLIVFTRWHPQDLVGYIEDSSNVIECNSLDDIFNIDYDDYDSWVKINFEAIKESDNTELDPRDIGQALWPGKHSEKKLLSEKKRDPETFACMNQGNPQNKAGLLYSPFREWTELPSNIIFRGNYTDTADQGEDYLCSINYVIDGQQNIYVTDIYYTQLSMETTESKTAELIHSGNVKKAYIESNNGGRGFGRQVRKLLQELKSDCKVILFSQSANKESRILTNCAQVNDFFMPEKWYMKHPMFYKHVTEYKRIFKANKFDDAPDVLTGIYEKSRSKGTKKGIKIRQ